MMMSKLTMEDLEDIKKIDQHTMLKIRAMHTTGDGTIVAISDDVTEPPEVREFFDVPETK